MCFLIAGVQPKTRTLDSAPRRCPQCGLHQAYTQQVDHYVSLFFIPLIRVKQGHPFLYCRRCQRPVANGQGGITVPPLAPQPPVSMCTQCGRSLEPDFKYCPYCGQRQ